VNEFVRDLLAEDRRARVVVLGDVNDFGFSKPLQVLKGAYGYGYPVLFDLLQELQFESATRSFSTGIRRASTAFW
jgi:predicted extracellular nuclease